MSCRIELAQRRDFKEFFDILENTIKKSKKQKNFQHVNLSLT